MNIALLNRYWAASLYHQVQTARRADPATPRTRPKPTAKTAP
jgi:hypothetical protein